MSINHYYSSYSSSELPEAQCQQWWSPYHIMDSPAKTSSSSPQHHHHNSHNNPHLINPSNHFGTINSSTTAAVFWPTTHPPMTTTTFSFNLNNNNNNNDDDNDNDNDNNSTTTSSVAQTPMPNEDTDEIPKEPLFEKPLTPSDVGKLNRLVIPKQHAEKYFPLNGGDSSEKGLLLGFEDEAGKSWRFRYSYWNSSQSYVLTKGWSRFVKEKRLDAGDIVVFSRHLLDAGRLFIGWRRRNSDGGGGWGRPGAAAYSSSSRGNNYQKGQQYSTTSSPYQPECLHAGTVLMQSQTATVGTASGNTITTTTNNNNNSKRLRLFGVNLDFPADESEPSTPDDSPMSQPHPYLHQFYSSSHHNYMDINFSGGDVYRQG